MALRQFSPPFEESNYFILRRHADDITVAYPPNCSPHISVLNTTFQAWPRFLHPSIELSDVIDLLLCLENESDDGPRLTRHLLVNTTRRYEAAKQDNL